MHGSRLLVATLVALVAGNAAAALCPASAAAAGGPILVTGIPDGAGIESPDGNYRYATVSASGTSVVRVVKGSGEIDSMAYLSGSDDESFAIPQVAADGSASGLAADGGTLVLIRTFGAINQAKLVVVGPTVCTSRTASPSTASTASMRSRRMDGPPTSSSTRNRSATTATASSGST
jgi:hypothetical protein